MFSYSLFRKELREHRWLLLIGTLVLTALGIFSAWSFDMLAMYGDMLQGFMPQLAEQFEQLLADYNFYIWSQLHPKNLLQFGIVLALILASTDLAGEVNRGSIQYLTGLPISRRTILITKSAAGMLSLSIIVWVSTLVTLVTAELLESGILWGKMLAATALLNIGLMAVYSFTLIFSALGNDAVKTGALAAAVLLIWSAAGLHPTTQFLSPFWHMKGINWFMGTGPFPWLSLVGLIIFALASLYIADGIFSKREF